MRGKLPQVDYGINRQSRLNPVHFIVLPYSLCRLGTRMRIIPCTACPVSHRPSITYSLLRRRMRSSSSHGTPRMPVLLISAPTEKTRSSPPVRTSGSLVMLVAHRRSQCNSSPSQKLSCFPSVVGRGPSPCGELLSYCWWQGEQTQRYSSDYKPDNNTYRGYLEMGVRFVRLG